MGRNLLMSSLENASFNIIFQIIFRCVTFIINAWVIRNVGHEVLGIMNVRLLLLESTILFLSREPFNRACLGQKDEFSWHQIINQIWLSVPLSCILSLFFVYIWLNVLPLGNPEYAFQYAFGCWSVALSCVIELCSANMALLAQLFCFVKLKVALDTLHIFVRTVIFLSVIIYDRSLALVAFSLAQVCSIAAVGIFYYIFFYWYIKNKPLFAKGALKNTLVPESILTKLYENMDDFQFTSLKDFLPKWLGSINSTFNKKLSSLTVSFAKQGIVKQLLTEGEKYVMSVSPVLSFSEQATYDVVNNLGSLAARFIFRPIEDSSYFYFTQMVSRELPLHKQDQHKIRESSTVLSQVCKTVSSIGLIVLVFGQSYAYTLLWMYGGESFVASGLPVQLLRSHCLAIVLLAVNGVTECYTFATMTSAQLNSYNYLMVFFSISFLIISYVLTYTFGPVGFIISNCINMFARIMHSIHFINKKYKDTGYKPLDGLNVGKVFLLILFIAGCICKVSENKLLQVSVVLHIAIGAVCFAFVLLAWAYENRELVFKLYKKVFQKDESKISQD
ncbi:man(5)GlcNAc(2)-PP-dolichol translocation protein RFT1 [Choristoneura fumiferana]|uniref:man(5)GlcNAc(2)-PP-dolichol translocation protein RFT1 n=1 Tax=Choristoneura fumiferana TaxID=7141 RepID=UPI003D15D5C4